MDTTDAPTAADANAAHEFLVELRTRITTQRLPYQNGVEAAALKSLFDVFGQARTVMKKYPGCEAFAAAVTNMLNVELRPVTSKWHRALEEGRLNSKDGADEFRGELLALQDTLRAFASRLHKMAYGHEAVDQETPSALSTTELKRCFAPLELGIPRGNCHLPDPMVESINTSEANEVGQRRAAYGLAQNTTNAVGLAFSGGGIRSATFSLGVTQVLAARDLLKEVDFLSTVSGGGYTGSALTTRLGTDTEIATGFAHPHGPDPGPIQYIRHHAQFLNPLNLKDAWTMFLSTVTGMVLNWTAPLFVIAALALVVASSQVKVSSDEWQMLLLGAGGLTAVGGVFYGALLRWLGKATTAGNWVLGLPAAVLTLVAGGWLVQEGYGVFTWLSATGSLSLASLVVVLGPAHVWIFPLLPKPAIRKVVVAVLLWAARLLIPLLALFFFYACLRLGKTSPAVLFDSFTGIEVLAGLVVFLFFVACLLNINLTAPHRIYRERLAKTFIQTTGNDTIPALTDLNQTHRAPYHLINTALNLPASQQPALRDRYCDFFLFSKHWSGSPVVGYRATSQWRMNNQPADLATAMAVSGAAASSYMGLGSMPTLTALLTFLNVRMGFWIRQPGPEKPFLKVPGFGCLLREMLGWGMNEKATWLNLSDGGHIENMAVYELLRRRCKFIICVDGEADPGFTFGGLLTLVRHAQIDFGVRLAPRVQELRPDPTTGWSQTHALLCRIEYPNPGQQAPDLGLLLYLKLSVTGNESELIQRYRALHPAFPHETTADQFFSEEQFEAYRQLGVHVAEGLFSSALMNNEEAPQTIEEWFRRLASNLLEPEGR